MSIRNSIAYRNCARRPGRSAALILLSFLLSFSVLGGLLVILGLQSGLNSLKTRLGADIMVVPYEATSKGELNSMILQGNPGYFYMDSSLAEKTKSRDGIEAVSEQFYLASTSSSCCSYKVQIIGYDPESDFTISPWVQLSDQGTLADNEVYVGSTLNAFAGDELTFYGSTVRVAGRLDETGTYLDTSVYANKKTIQNLISSAQSLGMLDFNDVDPENVVSCIMINVADGYSVQEVLDDINVHVRGVEAVQTQTMISDVAGKLIGISDIIGILIAVVWVLVLLIMVLAFVMISNERKKEFAVLRLLGASRKSLSGIVFREAAFVSIIGGLMGGALSVGAIVLFGQNIESMLNLPFLLPGGMSLAGLFVIALAAAVFTAAVSAAVCAGRISRVDAAVIMRGEN
ncbi:MAG: ABC transporter permease [Lachnospiraceae bacterium]|nr:ABC transporter permease [Lachnospiraceae bacterium]